MVDEKQDPILDDDLLTETLDNLPRISVPGVLLPQIMDHVMDEHIKGQVRSVFFPFYLFGLILLFAALSYLLPSDLSWSEFGKLLFSAPESGLLNHFHNMLQVCWYVIVVQEARSTLVEGLPLFVGIFVVFGIGFFAIRYWIRWMHRSSEERS